MATRTLPLTRAWTEVVGALSLTAGTDYYVEALGGPVELVRTERAGAPDDDARGRPIWPGSARRAPDARTYTPATGEYLHARAMRSDGAALVFDEEA